MTVDQLIEKYRKQRDRHLSVSRTLTAALRGGFPDFAQRTITRSEIKYNDKSAQLCSDFIEELRRLSAEPQTKD